MEENFQYLEDKNIKELGKFLDIKKSLNCDFTLCVKFSWHKYFETKYLIKDDTLYLKEKFKNYYLYSLPIGKNSDFKILIDDFKKNNYPFFEFANLSLEEAIELKKKLPHSDYFYDRMWSDYLYETSNFVDFKGNKFSNKRRQLHKFLRTYPDVIFEEAKKEDYSKIKDFIKVFSLKKNQNDEEFLEEENEAIRIIDYIEELNLKCFVIKDNLKIIGVTILELRNDIIFDHIEKCDKDYDGIYAFMINSIVNTFKDYHYMNREDDAGDEGLRFSKTELHPLKMIDKYEFKVNNNLDLLEDIYDIKVNDEIKLTKLKESMKLDYFNLYIDEELNKYWGYDYKIDLKDNPLNEDYFFNMVNDDFNKKESFTFIINYKNEFAGELVLYNLKNDNSAELGFRILKKFQQKGITFLAAKALINECFNEFKLKYLSIKSYKENIASIKFIKKIGAKFIEEDNEFYKFILE